MPKMEKTLRGDLDEIEKKLTNFILFNCSLTNKRESWETTVGDTRIKFSLFEKHAKRTWNETGKDWEYDPHYSMSLLLIDTGLEIRLCAMTGGSGHEMYFEPECGAEGELLDVLNTALILLDNLIVA